MPHMSDSEINLPKRRLRLAPEARVPLILDAALEEFSRRGFSAARMDDIAQRCGLSKGGLYAHFDSKDAIFKALLDRTLHRTDWARMPQLAAGADLSRSIWSCQAVISENLKASGRKDSVLARHPWLALSPMVHVLLWHAVFGEGSDPDPDFHQAHVDMLCELLA